MDVTAVDSLRHKFEVVCQDDLWSAPEALKALLANARALIVRNRTQLNKDLLQAAPNLQVIARLGVGLDNIDLDYCKSNDIEVCPAIGCNAAPVAEYVLTCAMLLARAGALSGTQNLKSGEWPRGQFSMGHEIAGKILGIVGFGSIGQLTAQRASAMGMSVIAHDDFLPANSKAWKDTQRVSLADLTARADIISLHCPLTKHTRHMIDKAVIAAMKPGAILINAARGGIVDEAACAAALRSGQLGGAALDVFEHEPIEAQTASLFKDIDTVILTPHIAGVTIQANLRASKMCAAAVMRVLGRPS